MLSIQKQLLNRKNKAKKKAPAPLTTDMLNELNKNHMGGVENYGHEEFYNIEDTWDDETDTRHHDGIKSKVKFQWSNLQFALRAKVGYFNRKMLRGI